VKHLLNLADRELRGDVDGPVTRRIRAYCNGFGSMAALAFDLKGIGTGSYLSQWQAEKAGEINGRLGVLHDDKLANYYLLYPKFTDRLPTLYGYIDERGFVTGPFASDSGDLRTCIERAGAVVIKPRDRSYGANVRVVEATTDGYLVRGDSEWRLERNADLASQLGCGLVTEFVEQTNYAREIYPHASNSIRIMTMIDPETGAPFIATASHRFGTARSAPVDNAAQGGISTGIDRETGTLGTSVSLSGGSVSEHFRHPDTDVQIEGRTIPG
jgi:hypothetical protein